MSSCLLLDTIPHDNIFARKVVINMYTLQNKMKIIQERFKAGNGVELEP